MNVEETVVRLLHIRQSVKLSINECIALENAIKTLQAQQRIKERIRSYRLDCEFAGLGMLAECKICNKNVFDSIEKIIDDELKGGKSEI